LLGYLISASQMFLNIALRFSLKKGVLPQAISYLHKASNVHKHTQAPPICREPVPLLSDNFRWEVLRGADNRLGLLPLL
jgi:hypothetical protein